MLWISCLRCFEEFGNEFRFDTEIDLVRVVTWPRRQSSISTLAGPPGRIGQSPDIDERVRTDCGPVSEARGGLPMGHDRKDMKSSGGRGVGRGGGTGGGTGGGRGYETGLSQRAYPTRIFRRLGDPAVLDGEVVGRSPPQPSDGGSGSAERGERVGFCRPPVQTRFKKGTSGNPKGRPRGSRNKPKPDGREELIWKSKFRQESTTGVLLYFGPLDDAARREWRAEAAREKEVREDLKSFRQRLSNATEPEEIATAKSDIEFMYRILRGMRRRAKEPRFNHRLHLVREV